MAAACAKASYFPEQGLIDELMTRVKRLELTLEYIASVANVYSADEATGKRFSVLRDVALEMINTKD